MIHVTFNEHDWQRIDDTAWRRHRKYANVPSNYGTSRDIHKDIVGAAGEWAVAKYFGLEWTGEFDDTVPDVGQLEVRTRTKQGGLLCLHDREIQRKKLPPGQKYVLCWYNEDDTVTMVGWAYATEIRKAAIYANGRWFIQNNKLHSILTVTL